MEGPAAASTAVAVRSGVKKPVVSTSHGVPEEILNDRQLQEDIAVLPANYNFEVYKTVWRVRKSGAKRVALQMPEGFLIYASVLSDILQRHCDGVETVVLGDVTFGACCVDDFTATALGCDFLVHYGHSCLVPVQECRIPMLYIFVDIKFDTQHLIDCLRDEFPSTSRLALLGTIQFVATIQNLKNQLVGEFTELIVPQAKPLSPGELLGCTAPTLPKIGDNPIDAIVYIADGRFHLEAVMIANPNVPAYKYDPYGKTFTVETYDHVTMMKTRHDSILAAQGAKRFGIVLSTLGRQGSPRILARIVRAVEDAGREAMVVLLSELRPEKLRLMDDQVDAWIQVACPRLSIDWSREFAKPLLTPYEAYVALGKVAWRKDAYPMDYYKRGGQEWTNYYKPKPTNTERGTETL